MQFQTGSQLDEVVDVEHVTAVDIGSAIAIVVIAIIVATVVRRILTKYLTRVNQLSDPVAVTVIRGITYMIVGIGVLLALPLLGFQIEPAMILVLVGAILLFFAGRPLMEDFSASLVLQTRTPFGVGDMIRHDEYLGTVVDIDGRATVIETPTGETVRIRNTTMLAEPIVNLTAREHRRSEIDVGVAYGTDLDHAIEVLRGAVTNLPLVLDHPLPQFMATSFDDSAITIQVWVWHLPTIFDEFAARDAVIRSIDRALRSEGIVITFPQRDVWMRNETSTPEQGTLDE
jgi:small conductance mechanosensitive channel